MSGDINRVSHISSINPIQRTERKQVLSIQGQSRPDSFISQEILAGNNSETQNLVITSLKKSYNELAQEYIKTRDQQGFLGRFWNSAKNTIGVSKEGKSWANPAKWWGFICNKDTGSKNVEKKLKELKKHIAEISKDPQKISQLYEKISGNKLTPKELQKIEKGENILADSQAGQAVKGFEEGQDMAVDIISDLAAGLTSFMGYAIVIGGLVATAGLPLAIAGGVALAATMGIGIKTGLKYADARSGGRDYTGKDLAYDTITGGINGLLAPITAGIGNAIGKAVATKMGVQVVEKYSGNFFARNFVDFGHRYTSSSTSSMFLQRGAALTAEMASDGALGGSIDNTARHIVTTGSIQGAFGAFIQGFLGGAILAPVIGGGFRLAGKAASPVSDSLNRKATNKVILPDGTASTFTQRADDCHLLAFMNSYMHNPTTAKQMSKMVETLPDGNYRVNLGDKPVIVNKSDLKAESLAEGAVGIRVIEKAYEKTGGLDGGFAEVVARDFNLNPVRIDKITDDVLDTLARDADDYVLTAGAYVGKDDNLTANVTNRRHLLSIEGIDSKARTVTLTDSAGEGTSKKITMSYQEFKNTFHEISGGKVKKSGDNPFSNVKQRQEGEISFKGGELSGRPDVEGMNTKLDADQKRYFEIFYLLQKPGLDDQSRQKLGIELEELGASIESQIKSVDQAKIDAFKFDLDTKLNNYNNTPTPDYQKLKLLEEVDSLIRKALQNSSRGENVEELLRKTDKLTLEDDLMKPLCPLDIEEGVYDLPYKFAAAYKNNVNATGSPYITQDIPEIFSNSGLTEAEVGRNLDKISTVLRNLSPSPSYSDKNVVSRFKLGDQIVEIKYIGGGEKSNAYKLTSGHKSCVLKVYKNRQFLGSHGVYGEAAIAIEADKANVSNIAKLRMTNPSRNGSWTISEYIPPDKQARKDGILLQDFLERHGLAHHDFKEDSVAGENYVVDLGGIGKK